MRKWWRDGGWWARIGGGALGFPIAVVVHELGHFGSYVAFGLPDPVLRYASVSWAHSGEFRSLMRAGDVEAAAALAEPWHIAVAAAAGPVVTYLTVIVCVLAVRRFGPGPLALVLGIGLVAPLRWVIAFPILAMKLTGERRTSNVDEGSLALITGIPESLLLLLGLACLVVRILVPVQGDSSRAQGGNPCSDDGGGGSGRLSVGAMAGAVAAAVMSSSVPQRESGSESAEVAAYLVPLGTQRGTVDKGRREHQECSRSVADSYRGRSQDTESQHHDGG